VNMTPEERDRLTILETKFDERWAEIAKYISKVEDHETFIDGLKAKLAIVGLGFTLFGSVFMLGIEWLWRYITHGGQT
jgi:hypothetical protein